MIWVADMMGKGSAVDKRDEGRGRKTEVASGGLERPWHSH